IFLDVDGSLFYSFIFMYSTTHLRPLMARWQLAMRSPASMAGQSRGKPRWRWLR
uniref:Uncharacterized protein n=1 Tax=Spermophilus dauricus TaxID=99837 RepID=A0A8C9QVR1_SPEDA